MFAGGLFECWLERRIEKGVSANYKKDIQKLANTYGYAYQNPIFNTDPTGLFVPQLAGGIAGASVSGWIYWEDYKCGRICLSEYLTAVAVGGGAGAISAGGSVLFGAGVAGLASAAQQAVTDGSVSPGKVAVSMATAGIGGKIGRAASKGIFPSKFITSFERRWYTLWLWDHQVVKEVYNKVGRDAATAAIGGGMGGGLSTVPSAVSGGDDCGCSNGS